MTPNVHWPSYIVKQKIYEQKARQGTKGKSKEKALFSDNSRPLRTKVLPKRSQFLRRLFNFSSLGFIMTVYFVLFIMAKGEGFPDFFLMTSEFVAQNDFRHSFYYNRL